MIPPISVQLYSLREQMKGGNHGKVLEALGKAGFVGVETAGLYDLKPTEFRRLCVDNGLQVSSAHIGIATPENLSQIVDTMHALGSRWAVGGFWTDDVKDAEAIKRTADKVRWAAEALAPWGIQVALHNHWQEFERLNGIIRYELMADAFPGLLLEIDTYWAANFGAERPAEMVRRFRDRTPLLHLKDGPFVKDAAMVACGSGKQDFPAILAAADPRLVQWAVIELDRCDTDMLQAVLDSYRYLVGKGLCGGRVR